jgi:hypothetical protein
MTEAEISNQLPALSGIWVFFTLFSAVALHFLPHRPPLTMRVALLYLTFFYRWEH